MSNTHVFEIDPMLSCPEVSSNNIDMFVDGSNWRFKIVRACYPFGLNPDVLDHLRPFGFRKKIQHADCLYCVSVCHSVTHPDLKYGRFNAKAHEASVG